MPCAISEATAACAAVMLCMGNTPARARKAASLQIAGPVSRARRLAVALTKPALRVLFRRLSAGLPPISSREEHAPLPHPHLRRAARTRHRRGGADLGLVPPHPRPRRPAVHRSARPL